MSDTPRTDALHDAFNGRDGFGCDDIIEAYDHARTLERENAELDRKWEVAARDAGIYCGTLTLAAQQLGCDPHMVDHAVAALVKDRARLDLLDAEALRPKCALSIFLVNNGSEPYRWAGIEWGDGTSVRDAIDEFAREKDTP